MQWRDLILYMTCLYLVSCRVVLCCVGGVGPAADPRLRIFCGCGRNRAHIEQKGKTEGRKEGRKCVVPAHVV
jgi:hypothetical protein